MKPGIGFGFGRFLVILVIISFFGCSGCDQQEAEVQPRFFELDDDVVTMMRLINDQRAMGATCGDVLYPATSPVSWNERLASAAAAHNADMIDNEFFSHTGSDGLTVRERADDAGYHWLSIGEVIAANADSVFYAFIALMDSPTHCRQIMRGDVDEVGMNVENTNDARQIWVINFGRD